MLQKGPNLMELLKPPKLLKHKMLGILNFDQLTDSKICLVENVRAEYKSKAKLISLCYFVILLTQAQLFMLSRNVTLKQLHEIGPSS
jgi:hypothetical protein